MGSIEAEDDMWAMGWGRCPGCGDGSGSCDCIECDHPECDEYGQHVERVMPADLDLCPGHRDYIPPEDECECSDPATARITGHGHACPLYEVHPHDA